MEKLSDEQRAIIQEAWMRAKARMALQQIQQEGGERRQRIERARITEATERARARMSGRTIDETGKDVNERQPEPEPESIQTGWYWTGRYTVWVVGPTVNGRGVYYQTAGIGHNWAPMRGTTHWQRVHQQVQESGQRFGWRPPAPNH